MARDSDWREDLRRYGGSSAFLRNSRFGAVWIYRFGRRIDQRPEGMLKRSLTACYWLAFRATETIVGVSLPKEPGRPGLGLAFRRNFHFTPEAVSGQIVRFDKG